MSVCQPSCEGLPDEPPATEASRDPGGFVEQRASVQEGEDLRVGVPYAVTPGWAQRRKYAGQLAALTTVESLQQTPVVACGQGELVIGKLEGPVASHNPRREIFVHDDHDGTLSRLREVGIAAAQEGIGGGNGVKAGLEVVNQVSGREPPQELAIGLRQTGIAGPTASTTFLEQFVTDAHVTIMPAIGAGPTVAAAAHGPRRPNNPYMRRLLVTGDCHTEAR